MPPNATGNSKPKATRAGGYHAKTGCITCKIRHVKCDEEKPECLRCRNTGRACDGYMADTKRATAVPNRVAVNTFEASPGPLQHARQFSIATSLNAGISGTRQERQCFEYFRCEIGRELSAAMLLEPTHHFVLRACHTDDTIKAAVLAIGSMGQRLRVHNLLTSDNKEANVLQVFAQSQYCKALRSLRTQMCSDPSQPIDLAIISCFLFTIFEFLQGNDAPALVHLRSGLNILQRENAREKAALGQDPLRQEITRIFSTMDRSAIVWVGVKPIQAPAMPLEPLDPAPPPMDHFLDIEEAFDALNYQIDRMYHFRHWVEYLRSRPDATPPNDYARHQDMVTELEQWPLAMNAVLETMNEKTLSADILFRVCVMKMAYKATIIQNSLCLEWSDEQDIQNRNGAEYLQIVSLARSIVVPMNDETRSRIERIVQANNRGVNPLTLFSLFTGIIHPLFTVAINCRNLGICQEATSLLSTSPWREGAFDSAAMARIATRKIQQSQAEGFYDSRSNAVLDLDTGLPARSPCDDASLSTLFPPTTQNSYQVKQRLYQYPVSWVSRSDHESDNILDGQGGEILNGGGGVFI